MPWARLHSQDVPGILATARILGAQGLVIRSFHGVSGAVTTGKISLHFQKCLGFSKGITWEFEPLSNFLLLECPSLASALTCTDREKIVAVC